MGLNFVLFSCDSFHYILHFIHRGALGEFLPKGEDQSATIQP